MSRYVFEPDSRPCDEVAHSACDKDLGWPSKRHHACADVNRDPPEFAIDGLHAAGMKTESRFQSELMHVYGDALGTADSIVGLAERHEESVAGRRPCLHVDAVWNVDECEPPGQAPGGACHGG